MQSKLNSYLGLAKKAGAVVYGLENIKKNKNKICVVVLSCDATEKMVAHIMNLTNKKFYVRILKEKTLDELLNTSNCKVIGITNKGFESPVINCEE